MRNRIVKNACSLPAAGIFVCFGSGLFTALRLYRIRLCRCDCWKGFFCPARRQGCRRRIAGGTVIVNCLGRNGDSACAALHRRMGLVLEYHLQQDRAEDGRKRQGRGHNPAGVWGKNPRAKKNNLFWIFFSNDKGGKKKKKFFFFFPLFFLNFFFWKEKKTHLFLFLWGGGVKEQAGEKKSPQNSI